MKLTKTSRVTAMILALLMIVPLISVPVFAEDSANIIAKHTFDDITAVSDSITSANPSLSLVEFEGRGNVLMFDLTDGASGSDTTFYLAKDQNNGKVAVDVCTPNGNNTYNGYFMDGSTKVYFKNANGTTKTYATRAATTFYTLADDGVTENAYVYDGQESGWYLMTEAAINAWRGGGNIASAVKVKHDAITADVVTYSADYYFDAGFVVNGENKLSGDSFRGLGFSNNSGNVNISKHGNSTISDGASVNVADNTWVNLTIVANLAAGTYRLYVDGVYAFTATEPKGACTPGADTWQLIQANRAQTAYAGFVLVDNATIYEGEVIPAAADLDYTYVETFDSGKAGSSSLQSYVNSGYGAIVSGSAYGNRDGKVLEVGFDTKQLKDNGDVGAMDKGGVINNRAFDYKNDQYVTISHDIYIPTNTVAQFQCQIHPIINNGTSADWASLWIIQARASGDIVLQNDQVTNTRSFSVAGMQRDQWNTVKCVINLETGVVNEYVNGELYRIFNWSTYTNLTFAANKIYAVKMNKISNSATGDDGYYVGKVAFDNISVTADAPASTKKVVDFSNYIDPTIGSYLTSTANAGYVSVQPGTAYGKDASDKVMEVALGTAGISTKVGPVDQNGQVAHRAYDYENDTHMVVQQDLYIPTGTAVQLQSQIYGVKPNNGDAVYWSSLWQIFAKNDGSLTLGNESGWDSNLTEHHSAMARDTWNTITTDINLVSGRVLVYVNGVLYREFDWGNTKFSNISIDANQAIVAKLNNITFTYKGSYAFDNIGVYSSVEEAMANHPGTIADTRFLNYDYEDATVGEAATDGIGGGPSTAKYADLNGNTVIQIDMVASDDTEATLGSSDGTNTDKMFRVDNPAINLNALLPERNAPVVYSADYYINADANGYMESQFYANKTPYFVSLYDFDFGSSLFNAGGTKLSFNKGEWLNVKTVISILDDNSYTADIYLNGIYAGTRSIPASFIVDNSWSVAKIMKAGASIKTGSFYFDNVSISAYDASLVGETVDLTNAITYTVDGKTYTNRITGTKATYGVTSVTALNVADYFEANELLKTEDLASIRLEPNYSAHSGIRYATKVNTATLAAIADLGISVTEMGTLIAPTDFTTQKGELSLDSGAYTVGSDLLKIVAGQYNTALGLDNDDATEHFVGSIVKIKEMNLTRDFSGRGYMTVKLANGTVINVYSAFTKSIDVADQAQKTLDLGIYGEGTTEYNILSNFAAAAAQ